MLLINMTASLTTFPTPLEMYIASYMTHFSSWFKWILILTKKNQNNDVGKRKEEFMWVSFPSSTSCVCDTHEYLG